MYIYSENLSIFKSLYSTQCSMFNETGLSV
jgi:hypothetical protein